MNNITEVPECFYRISVKALVLNETRDKFLVARNEDTDMWDLPGGGLDWGAKPADELQRELQEEMGLQASWIADHPSYFVAGDILIRYKPKWGSNVCYETILEHLDFTPSDECIAIDWLGKDNADQFKLFPNVELLLEQFDPARHQK